MRLLSLASAAVLVVLATTTLAVWLNTGPPDPDDSDPYGLQTGGQPAGPRVSTSPAAHNSTVASPPSTTTTVEAQSPTSRALPVEPGRVSAEYTIRALQGKGGFDVKVTLQNPGQVAWRLVFTLAEDKTVENRSDALVMTLQQGSTIAVTPVRISAPQVVFTLRVPALTAPGSPIVSCTVDGGVCAAA